MISKDREFWDYALSKPDESDLVGVYTGTLVGDPRVEKPTHLEDVTLTLGTHGVGSVSALAVFDPEGRKLLSALSGQVTWRVGKPYDPHGEAWWLEITIRLSDSTDETTKQMLILEQRPPHRFFMIVGCPDDYVGIELRRVTVG
jgi:hypothetical protein